MFLEVALPLPLRQTFYYRCPPFEFRRVQTGQRVLVPFRNRKLTGYVIHQYDELPLGSPNEGSIREIFCVLDGESLISPEIFRLAGWVSDYYFASLGDVLKCCLPTGVNLRSKNRFSITEAGLAALSGRDSSASLLPAERAVLAVFSEKPNFDLRQVVSLAGAAIPENTLRKLLSNGWLRSEQVLDRKVVSAKEQLVISLENGAATKTNLTESQASVIRFLEKSKWPVPVSTLHRELLVSYSTLRSMARKRMVHLYKNRVQRDPFEDVNHFAEHVVRELTLEQKQVFGELDQSVRASHFVPVLLHGVTGSGKTEIYLSIIECMLREQKDSLVLMPEIGLTPRVAQEFRARLGHDVAILHSGLSDGERFDEWWRIKRGDAKVVIGTRSAVFAPLQNLKLIVVDEEHDPSYKQQESPRYHARDTALMRGKLTNSLVILGSATPAIETFYNARKGKYKYLSLPSRVNSRPLPAVRLVDMRMDFTESRKRSVFSRDLSQAIQERLSRGEQILILLNRRGFSGFVTCRSCGQNIRCRNCSISLSYHKKRNVLLCHYCGYAQKTPKLCPHCGSEYLHYLREGTEKAEALLARMFPAARISRLDRDSAGKKNAHAQILSQFQKQQVDILLGTQMISKGHDFPNVTLVGILSADHSLAFPDFHCAERTFQLLSQMSGRAGRGELAGEVLIQTFYPEHYCLKFVTLHDFTGFYEKEIRFRQFMHYPPFTALANILVRDKNLESAVRTINLFNDLLREYASSDIKILGPTLSPLAKIKLEHRFQMLIKSKSRRQLKEVLKKSLLAGTQRGLELRKVHIDIDPVTLM